MISVIALIRQISVLISLMSPILLLLQVTYNWNWSQRLLFWILSIFTMSKSVIVLRNSVSTSLYSSDESCSRTFYQRRRRELLIKDKSSINPNVYIRRLVFWATFQIHPNFVYHQDVITINTRGGNLLAPHNSIRFRLWGQRFDSEAIIDASQCNNFFYVHFHAWFSKKKKKKYI